MPDDRFGDLERRAPGERTAADRLSELDAREDDEHSGEPAPPARVGSRYTWVVGVVALVAIAFAAYNSLLNVGVGEGIRGPEPGTTLPDFAAPTLQSFSEAGPNVQQAGAEGGVTPACEVQLADVVNICELREDGPVVVTFVAVGSVGGARCEAALDVVERVKDDFPGVAFVGVVSFASEEEVADLRERDWDFPVAADPDGAVYNLYRVADCPVTVLADPGGRVSDTVNGFLDEQELARAVEAIEPAGERP